eukprot:TRINITY_DN2048_c0_g1_i5.p1 TRINITY_DN2048_c0_g1~~TRINITY_DN2048_c0_g1_i5.p1  ORF type:complete len:243 (+),score=52.10 TRINITY_DN2048_c0_g1_i5:157-885(+)
MHALRRSLETESNARGNRWQNPRYIDISDKPAPGARPAADLSDVDMGFRVSKVFPAGTLKGTDSFATEVRLTMNAATKQFALLMRERRSGADRRQVYFYQTILQGKFKRDVGNHFKFQSMDNSVRWQSDPSGVLFGSNERNLCFFVGVVTQDQATGCPVGIDLTLTSRGPWDSLEATEQVTGLESVPRIEFGGWFLADDAEAVCISGEPVVFSEQGPHGIAGKTGQRVHANAATVIPTASLI